MKFRIYYEDTDAQGIVYHSNYFKFCERARSEAFIKSGIDIFSSRAYFVVNRIEAKFIKSAVFGDMIEIKTGVDSIKKASAVIRQDIYKVQNLKGENINELLFSAFINVVYMKDKKPSKFDENVLNFLKSF